MIVMDLKGVSWVGDMYQKFEAMCVEAEEVMYEDTLKYVEDQMRTVGKSVKKFYSDVMQDLIPPSSLDSAKGDDPLVTAVQHSDAKIDKIKEVDDENEPVSVASEQLMNDIDGTAARKDSIDKGSYCSTIYSVIKPCEPTSHNFSGEKCVKENTQSHGNESVLLNQATYMAKDLDCRKDSQSESLSKMSSVKVTTMNNSGEEVSFIEPYNESDEPSSVHGDATLLEASKLSYRGDGVGSSLNQLDRSEKTRRLFGGNLSTDSNRHLSTVIDETSSPFLPCEIRRCDTDQAKLEESCVLVEKNDNKSAVEQVQKSYKKKFQNVFSPRRWSKSKREQEQLAAWYEEQMGKNLVSTSMMQAEILKLQTSESSESDWELL